MYKIQSEVFGGQTPKTNPSDERDQDRTPWNPDAGDGDEDGGLKGGRKMIGRDQ